MVVSIFSLSKIIHKRATVKGKTVLPSGRIVHLRIEFFTGPQISLTPKLSFIKLSNF